MKIYIITKGDYSDYHICGVATDPEAAEKLRILYTDRWDEAYVDEFDTDDFAKELDDYAPAFRVHYEVEEDDCSVDRDRCNRGSLRLILEDTRTRGTYFEEFIEYRDGMTKEKAKKIFFDDLAKYRAEKEGLI